MGAWYDLRIECYQKLAMWPSKVSTELITHAFKDMLIDIKEFDVFTQVVQDFLKVWLLSWEAIYSFQFFYINNKPFPYDRMLFC